MCWLRLAICTGAILLLATANARAQIASCRALNAPSTILLEDRRVADAVRKSVFQLNSADGTRQSGTATLILSDGELGYFLTVRHNFVGKAGFELDSSGQPKAAIFLQNGVAKFAVSEVWLGSSSASAPVDVAVIKAKQQTGSTLSAVEIAVGWGIADAASNPVPSIVIIGYWLTETPTAPLRTPVATFERFATSERELKSLFREQPPPTIKPLDAILIGSTAADQVRSGDSGSIAFDAQGYGLGLLTEVRTGAFARQGKVYDAVVMIPISSREVRDLLVRIPITNRAKELAETLRGTKRSAVPFEMATCPLTTLEWLMVIHDLRVGLPASDAVAILVSALSCKPLNTPFAEYLTKLGSRVKATNAGTALEMARAMERIAGSQEVKSEDVRIAATNVTLSAYESFAAQSATASSSDALSAKYTGRGLSDYSKFLLTAGARAPNTDMQLKYTGRALAIAAMANTVDPSSPYPYDIATRIHKDSGNYAKAAAAKSMKIEEAQLSNVAIWKNLADLQYLTGKAVGAEGFVTCRAGTPSNKSAVCTATSPLIAMDIPKEKIDKVLGIPRIEVFGQ